MYRVYTMLPSRAPLRTNSLPRAPPLPKIVPSVASITTEIEATAISKYSDRFKQQQAKDEKAAVDTKSLTEFPSLKATNTVVAKPVMAWAQTVKDAMTAATEKAALEAVRQKQEEENRYRYTSAPIPSIRSYDVKGEEAYEDYAEEEYYEQEEEKGGGGTPPYGNRGYD